MIKQEVIFPELQGEMPRYFFNVHDRYESPPDEEGTELEGLEAMRQHALTAARSLISDDVQQGILDLRGTIEVRDDAGTVLFVLRFDEALMQVHQ